MFTRYEVQVDQAKGNVPIMHIQPCLEPSVPLEQTGKWPMSKKVQQEKAEEQKAETSTCTRNLPEANYGAPLPHKIIIINTRHFADSGLARAQK